MLELPLVTGKTNEYGIGAANEWDNGDNLIYAKISGNPKMVESPGRKRSRWRTTQGTEERLAMDRLSCHRLMANFFRLLLHTVAFNLLNAVRDHEALPKILRDGQPCSWRTMLIKVAPSSAKAPDASW